ncbi:MAG: heme ABC exporter ATP-binding protein CcmA [Burkholderiales bacterium]|nr:heme ABC exporter ATP-binding protein CcmA [Burkholderiales bacterium]
MLSAARLTCQRGDAVLFRALGFELAAGEALMVRGANGSGKTSLLRILAGVAAPVEGEIFWRNSPDRQVRQRETAYQGHTAPLKDELTVIENLDFALALDGCSAERPALLDTIKAVGLAARRNLPVRHLSQGQRRRVGLARLMLAKRPLWLLDEPATALDAAGLALFCDVLDRHLAEGGLAVLSTHQSLPLTRPVRELNL